MIARARLPVLVILIAAVAAYFISMIPTLGLASADVVTIEPPPETARTPAPSIPADLPRDTTVDDVAAPWRRGEYVVAGLAALALLLGVALRIDPKRAAYYTAGLGAFAACIDLVHAGKTPNTSMLVGAAAAFVLWMMRSPLPVRPSEPRDPQRGSVNPLLAIAFVPAIVAGSLAAWSCAPLRSAAREGAPIVVDCTLISIGEHATELEAAIRDATDLDGSIDWTRIRAAVRELGEDVGGCALRAAIERILEARGVQAMPRPREGELRAGWERVRVEVLGGRRYLPEAR